jgi:hypothetical protein
MLSGAAVAYTDQPTQHQLLAVLAVVMLAVADLLAVAALH